MTADKAPVPYRRITVLGAGAWGTALAAVAATAGREVTLWGRDKAVLDSIARARSNPAYLPGITLPEGIATTPDLAHALQGAEAVLLVTPAATVRALCRQIAPHLPANIPLALCAKGIEAGSGLLLGEVVREELPNHPVGALSGPSFAVETARGLPTAATIAFPFRPADRQDPATAPAVRLALSLSSEMFRPYISDDLIGVEVGGAVKNVIAIACGMMIGAGFAENTRAVLITRGLEEMSALALALGGRRETLSGLSGVGDLTLTCGSTNSRNLSLGIQLGKGIAREECFEGRPVVVEGEGTARSLHDLTQRIGMTMPISEAVYRILHEGAPVAETFAGLWTRPLRGEPAQLDLSLEHPLDAAAVAAFARKVT
ncbi:NAD(P)H-dependent glycerol-3-phosphate dehydrogenase [Oceanibium sediminis]|uniref:NAD(P)H-dependent glycerol-3-phosphate dehydrogenase n=1 Tax=Oceanibium sediminis TaxID=2026339 RepID=UPI000DD2C444|nr:NAD(P)H-dependent glycerol-3-phosphate dehydrogenase [Oceanibium sediminis]